jgi:hypothetical protein
VQLLHRLLQFFGKARIHPVLHVQAIGADAGLPGVTKLRRHGAFYRFIQIGIIKHDKRRVTA